MAPKQGFAILAWALFAALIQARPCAGDLAAGAQLLRDLSPFIWRQYLDYATIADVHEMKRQIHAYRGHGGIAVEGHNIKLGRGGIREIEFFAQTQQLIAGGQRTLAYDTAGYLKWFHAVTLHAVLVLPAVAWLLARSRLDEAGIRSEVTAAAIKAVLSWSRSFQVALRIKVESSPAMSYSK